MATPAELDFTQPAATPAPDRRAQAGALLGATLHWAPVWAPLVFLGQLVFLGLLPARAESQRLDRAELEVEQRAEALSAEQRELAEQARMLSDDMFQERVRRSLVAPGTPPLTLERARKP